METGTCKECEGEGRILHHDPINRDEFYLMCDECNGLGTVILE